MKKLLLGLSALSVGMFVPLAPMMSVMGSGFSGAGSSSASADDRVVAAHQELTAVAKEIAELDKAFRQVLAKKESSAADVEKARQLVVAGLKKRVSIEDKIRQQERIKKGIVINAEQQASEAELLKIELANCDQAVKASATGIWEEVDKTVTEGASFLGRLYSTVGRRFLVENTRQVIGNLAGQGLVMAAQWVGGESEFDESMAAELTLKKEFTDAVNSLVVALKTNKFFKATQALKDDETAKIVAFIAAIEDAKKEVGPADTTVDMILAAQIEAGLESPETSAEFIAAKKKSNLARYAFVPAFAAVRDTLAAHESNLTSVTLRYFTQAKTVRDTEIAAEMARLVSRRVVALAAKGSDGFCDTVTRYGSRFGVSVGDDVRDLMRGGARWAGGQALVLSAAGGQAVAESVVDTAADALGGLFSSAGSYTGPVGPRGESSRFGGVASSGVARPVPTPGDFKGMINAALLAGNNTHLMCKFGPNVYAIPKHHALAKLVGPKLTTEYGVEGISIFTESGTSYLRWASADPMFESRIAAYKVK